MSDTYKMVTLVGTSATSFADAARNAVKEASGSLRHLGWFEVKELRGRIQEGRIAEYQVKVDVGFKVEG
jgi:flavin-binding protein dodecin